MYSYVYACTMSAGKTQEVINMFSTSLNLEGMSLRNTPDSSAST